MARPTDTERGARIAFGIATMRSVQPDLFPHTQPDREFWAEILAHAADQLIECQAHQQARAA